MEELKLTGNCLRGSRPLLSFDETFTTKPHHLLLKELLTQIFGVPKHHPKSQPFFDHVYTFAILDNRIWFRNFQILSEDGALAEIGPQFVLNPVKIFSGSFGGAPLWENPSYVSPAKYRQQVRLQAKHRYLDRIQQKVDKEVTMPKDAYNNIPQMEDMFKEGQVTKNEKIVEQQKKGVKKVKNGKLKTKKAKKS